MVGQAFFRERSDGVLMRMEVKGLTPGLHAVHVHSVGKCEGPGFISAAGHFNPAGKKHGLNSLAGPHAGDLPNMLVARTVRAASGSDRCDYPESRPRFGLR